MMYRAGWLLVSLCALSCGEDDPGDEPASEQAIEEAVDEATDHAATSPSSASTASDPTLATTDPVTGPTGTPALGVVGSAPRCDASAFVADGATAPIRQGPASSAPVVATAAPGAFVFLAESGNGWLRVYAVQADASAGVASVGGWVASAQVRIDLATGTASTASLHQAPAEASPVVAEVSAGGTVVGCVADWLQVEVDNATGWLAVENQCVRNGAGCL